MKNEIDVDDRFRWVILDKDRADKFNISLIKLDDDKTLLSIDIAFIPQYMSILEYIEWIQDTGIVLNLSLKK